MIDISAKKEVNGEVVAATIGYEFGENLKASCDLFTEDVVFTNARASFKITAQAAMRRYLSQGLNAEGVAEKMKTWKPGVAMERSYDPAQALIAKWGSLSDEEKADILKKLKK